VITEALPTHLGLLVLNQDPTEWARRYDIEPFSYPCYWCGRMKHCNIPFVRGTLRGLAAARCPCGSTEDTYCMVRDQRFGDLLDGDLSG